MAGSGNGTDLGHIVAMLSDVLEGQRDIRGILNERSRVLNEHSRVLNEHTLKLDEHDRRFDDLTGQVLFLREAVTAYHSSVMGDGFLIAEPDARVRRIEHRLDMPPAA